MSKLNPNHTIRIVLLFVAVLLFTPGLSAQTDSELEQAKQKAFQLVKDQKFLDALPLLERLSIEAPADARVFFNLGFALLAKANVIKDETEKTNLRLRGRKAFIKAKELGIQEPVVDSLIQSLPPDGVGSEQPYSSNKEADKLLAQGEAQFSKGELDGALRSYEKALKLDPNLYEAALFSGDIYVTRADFRKAEESYQRAILINPNRETAYRYSATPLMKQNKFDEARDRYVEAYITEPYNRFSRSGLIQWSQVTGVPVGHPKLEIPAIEVDSSGNVQVDLGSNALPGARENGTYFWKLYGPVRSRWRKESFAKTFPTETQYRHSLAEEVEALRAVLAGVKSDNSIKKLDPSLEMLHKLNEKGYLESYLLLARPDEGISLDHPKYLKDNRDKMRRYVKDHVIGAPEQAESKPAPKENEVGDSKSLVEKSYDSEEDETSVKIPFAPITCLREVGCIFYSLENSYPGRKASGKVDRTVFALIILTKAATGAKEQALSIQVDGKLYDLGKVPVVADENREGLRALIYGTTLREEELAAIANGKKVDFRFGQAQFSLPERSVKAFAEFYNAAKTGQ